MSYSTGILVEYPLLTVSNGVATWTGNVLLGNWFKAINGESSSAIVANRLLGLNVGNVFPPDAAETATVTKQLVKVRQTTAASFAIGVSLSGADLGEECIVAGLGSLVHVKVATATTNVIRGYVYPTSTAGQVQTTSTFDATALVVCAGRVWLVSGTSAGQSGSSSHVVMHVNPF